MNCQNLFSGENSLYSGEIKENIINLSSAKLAQIAVNVNPCPAEPRYVLPLQGFGVQDSKQEVANVVSLVKNEGKSTECIKSP